MLLGGLVCGWLRSMWPRFFGRIPGPTLWVFESIGLAGFVAVVGLDAGPDFVVGLRTSGAEPRGGRSAHGSGAASGRRAWSGGGCSGCTLVCCSESAPAPEPRPRRWRRSRRPRRVPCRLSATACPTPWATCCSRSGAPSLSRCFVIRRHKEGRASSPPVMSRLKPAPPPELKSQPRAGRRSVLREKLDWSLSQVRGGKHHRFIRHRSGPTIAIRSMESPCVA